MIKFITPTQKEFLQFVVSSNQLVAKFKPVLQEVIDMGCYSDEEPARGFEGTIPPVSETDVLNRIRDHWLDDYKEHLHNLNE